MDANEVGSRDRRGGDVTDPTLDARLRALIADRVPGVALAIVGPDGLRCTASAGSADLAASVPTSPEMTCPWFSMTKIVTATTAMRLSDRGVLDLDEPLLPHVPAMEVLEPRSAAERITARHLLAHAAGLVNPIPVKWIHPPDAPGPEPDAFLSGLLAKNRRLRSEPGSRSSYSNLGTLTLGAAMTSVSRTPFVELVRSEVLEPLGMARTGFAYTPSMQQTAAVGYHPRRSPMRYLLPRWVIGDPVGRWLSLRRFLLDGAPYGGLVGSVDDVARFLQMHLRDGELDGVRILEPASVAAMREITLPGTRFDLGLGWFRPSSSRDADPPFVEHLGGGAGFFNVIRMYPTLGIGAAVMGNATKYDIDAVARLALEG
jgi:CubicO group peptidase (beta-lactamase class C family)